MPDPLPPLDRTVAPSPTALRVAVLRALHQTLDQPPIFVDPLAARILGPNARALLDTHRATAGDSARLRGTLAARTVVAEEAVAAAVAHGVRQCVILGAGLDTFAYRQRHSGLRLFEVDQPKAQAWKRAMLKAAEIVEPASLAFVAVDLAQDDLISALVSSGLDASLPITFVMLGVTPYIAADAVLDILGRIAKRCARDTEIIFDYTEPYETTSDTVRAAYATVSARVAAGGEPWITFFKPDDLHPVLRDCGFSEIDDLDAAALEVRFLVGRTDALSIAALVHVVRAVL